MKRCSFVLLISLLFIFCTIDRNICNAQAHRASATKHVVLRGDNNQDLFFFPTERLFDLSCRVIGAGEVSATDAETMRKGMVKILRGTHADQLSRNNHFVKIKNEWVGKVFVRLTSGGQKGKRGYIFAKWVFPVKGNTVTKKKYSVVSIYDTSVGSSYLFKSRRVFDLTVRGMANEELTHEEQGIILHGTYELAGRTHAHLISSKDKIPTSDGRYTGYSYVEITNGMYKGKRGFVFIDQVHK